MDHIIDKIEKLFVPYKGLPREVYVLFFSKTINSMGNFVIPLLTLILTQKIGLSKATAGFYLTVLSIFYAPGLLLGGKLVDTLGRKKIILFFHGIASCLFIVCGIIKPSIIMVYILIGATTAFSVTIPAYDAMLADLTTSENRKAAYSLLYMGHNLGFAIAPVIAGLLYKNYLSLVFIGDAVTTIISITVFTIFVKETMHRKQEVSEESKKLEKEVRGSVISVLFERPVLLYFAIILFCYNFAYSQWGFTMPLHLTDLFQEEGAKYYGILAGFNGVVVIISTPFISRVTHSMRPIRSIAIGGFFYALAFGLLAFIEVLPLFFISITIMTLGEVLISINTSTFIANSTPASHRGRVNAVMPMIFGAGYTLGPVAMGHFLKIYSIKTAWLTIAMIVLIAGILMLVLGRNHHFHNRKIIK